MVYRYIIRPLLFSMDAEAVHGLAFKVLGLFKLPLLRVLVKPLFNIDNKDLGRTVFGLYFPNPIGLAAGFDKNAESLPAWKALGFGFVEIGTVTPRPQAGNDKPRLFRLAQDKALINRMGFNNKGMEVVAAHLRKRPAGLIIGGNLGKNKDTPNQDAVNDYIAAYDALYSGVDYFVVNVSSPNTPGLRALQDKEPLMALLAAVQSHNRQMPQPKPVLLKIAPDLTNNQLDDIIEIVAQTDMAGVIATNTTISRSGLLTPAQRVAAAGAGGLSGAPVKERSTEVINYLHTRSKGAFPIIGAGGVFTAKDALEKLNAGASLVQVYTGFVYNGPGMVKNLCKGLAGAGIKAG